jgi:hypothetical protein
MKILVSFFYLTIYVSAFAQSPNVKAYLIKDDEIKKIRVDTLKTISSLKLSDTTYKIVSFNFGFTVHSFTRDTVFVIKNVGALFNEEILLYTKKRIRPGTTILIDEIIIQNRKGKTEKVDMVYTNVY